MPKGLQPIAAPFNRQATTGLIALASQATVAEGADWEAGFGYRPEPCDGGQLLAIGCGASETKTAVTKAGLVAYMPAMLVIVDYCTTMDRGYDAPGVAERAILNQQSELLERLLWTGVAAGDPAGNDERPHLADGRATVLTDATSPGQAVALMDQALTDCLHGVPGMVHVTPYTLVVLKAAGVLERDGNRWITPNGHTVVAGAGYTGGGPRPSVGGVLPAVPNLLAVPPENQFMYGTGPVSYLLGTLEVFADTSHRLNSQYGTAERPGAAFFGCCQFALELDLTPA